MIHKRSAKTRGEAAIQTLIGVFFSQNQHNYRIDVLISSQVII
ncbi:hypothetical protein O53_599 [Microcystis aeruginosa TAIHU98]|uniref:Uncharacterized protein n=2 Tax=Microcystis aeruginosa TaxID=1126 RepID=L7E970_MICAE|nr:hypothetical protein BH695_1566 [Microcystis aeruginosa PCC 7806SL]ELP56000.1 hypothetical protein O53_599 [Microcystis aeruginosa TAIHU98]ELS49697.1 hypothetical protein C789_534 [Microcystis aeruginosa FACHB-905 = DIANCHI905]ODV36903.1 hypothetical protein BFG60_3558 [Microcystis aeruginosa NIES-98]